MAGPRDTEACPPSRCGLYDPHRRQGVGSHARPPTSAAYTYAAWTQGHGHYQLSHAHSARGLQLGRAVAHRTNAIAPSFACATASCNSTETQHIKQAEGGRREQQTRTTERWRSPTSAASEPKVPTPRSTYTDLSLPFPRRLCMPEALTSTRAQQEASRYSYASPMYRHTSLILDAGHSDVPVLRTPLAVRHGQPCELLAHRQNEQSIRNMSAPILMHVLQTYHTLPGYRPPYQGSDSQLFIRQTTFSHFFYLHSVPNTSHQTRPRICQTLPT